MCNLRNCNFSFKFCWILLVILIPHIFHVMVFVLKYTEKIGTCLFFLPTIYMPEYFILEYKSLNINWDREKRFGERQGERKTLKTGIWGTLIDVLLY